MKCWICNSEANSSEHKFKKKDFKRLWGKGPYRGKETVAHVANGIIGNVHGPDSARAKYPPCLCDNCNNNYTQPFDLAYDKFIDYFDNHKKEIDNKRVINWESVYGKNFVDQQRNLYRYFAKCFGCRLANFGAPLPKDIIDLLGQERFQTGLRITFSINEDLKLLPEKDQGLGIHPLHYYEATRSQPRGYFCGQNYKWLDFNFFYMTNSDIGLGAPWVADAQFIYIGFQYTLSDEMRNELLEKIKFAQPNI